MTADDYFSDRSHVLALAAACTNWLGTPFRARSVVRGPGGGVDCAGFVGAVFAEIGAIPLAVAVPPYEVNHAEHSDQSLLRAWFELPAVRVRVRRVDEGEEHLDGDLVFPRVGRCEHHLGIRIGALVWHVARPSGVCAMTLAQLQLAPSRYRLLEEAPSPASSSSSQFPTSSASSP
ncbi:MAG: C40 family peptidase [Verrucomicrobia bacterium]|nr:C40 family peptidase [Verrucomicrobiota bacterium]